MTTSCRGMGLQRPWDESPRPWGASPGPSAASQASTATITQHHRQPESAHFCSSPKHSSNAQDSFCKARRIPPGCARVSVLTARHPAIFAGFILLMTAYLRSIAPQGTRRHHGLSTGSSARSLDSSRLPAPTGLVRAARVGKEAQVASSDRPHEPFQQWNSDRALS